MQVSSTLLSEAAKLFWADLNTYYVIESRWLFDGGHPSDTYYELPFLAHVQNVEVEYQQDSDDRIGPILQNGHTMDINYNTVYGFWNTLTRRFPQVKRVIINQPWESMFRGSNKPIPRCLQILVKSCPPEINVSTFILDKESVGTPPINKWERSLYRLTIDNEWEKLTQCIRHKSIFMAVKRFHGPVGKFMRIEYMYNRTRLQEFALGPLMVEALDRYYFNDKKWESFLCPEPACNTHFNKPRQFILHAVEKHRFTLITGTKLDILPKELRDRFERRKSALESMYKELDKDIGRIYAEWNEEGTKKREYVKSEWINYLQNDKEWGSTSQNVTESKIWEYFTRRMDPMFCRY
jgi:hypothetical protein